MSRPDVKKAVSSEAVPSAARMAQLTRATEHLDPPFAVVDLDAFDANAADLARRTAGRATIRLASKSVRSRALIRRAVQQPGYQGILAFTLPEALWLAEEHPDVVIGYPTTDRAALRRLAADEQAASRTTLMIDSIGQLDFIDPPTVIRRAQVERVGAYRGLHVGVPVIAEAGPRLRDPADLHPLADVRREVEVGLDPDSVAGASQRSGYENAY